MSAWAQMPAARTAPGAVFVGKVSRVITAGSVGVTLDAYGDLHEWPPATWIAAGQTPGRGDPVLVLIDDRGALWAFPSALVSAGATGGGQALTMAIGDGSSRVFPITHGFGARAVPVVVYTTAAPYSEVDAEVEHTDENTVTVRTKAAPAAAPATNEYTVAVIAPGTAVVTSGTLDIWHTVADATTGMGTAFLNGWSHYGAGGEPPAQFRKAPDGRVLIRGLVKNGTLDAAMFTLPAGYRPPPSVANMRFPVLATNTPRYALVDSGGNVVLTSQGAPTTTWVDLSPIEFDTDTTTSLPVSLITDVPEVAALPNPGADGQVVDLLVDAAGVAGGPIFWRCRYRAATPGTARWHVLSAVPLFAEIDAYIVGMSGPDRAITLTTYTALAVPLTVALPSPGVYQVEISFGGYNNTAGQLLAMSYDVGATAATDVDAVGVQLAVSNTDVQRMTRSMLRTFATALTLTAKWRVSGGSAQARGPKAMKVTPIRIGP